MISSIVFILLFVMIASIAIINMSGYGVKGSVSGINEHCRGFIGFYKGSATRVTSVGIHCR